MGSPYSPKAKSILTCEIPNQIVNKETEITIKGSIWPEHLASIFIQISEDEGSTWNNLGVATTERGNYSFKWKPKDIGVYLLRSFWTGDMDHKEMFSPIVRVEVK
jgi:hypothetical protein